jgi:hypothetical protein
VSPAFSRLLIQLEKRPPGTLRTPTRSSLVDAAAQIEYERRRSCPSCTSAQRQVLARLKRRPRASGRHVEGHDDRVVGVGSHRTHRRGWK